MILDNPTNISGHKLHIKQSLTSVMIDKYQQVDFQLILIKYSGQSH